MSLMRVRRVGSGLGNTPHGAGCGAVLDRVAAPVSGNPCGQRREELRSNLVLAGLVPTIHVLDLSEQDVDTRVEHAQDDLR